jgi:alpha-ketoglutarate-dependent taurine dioxygenase
MTKLKITPLTQAVGSQVEGVDFTKPFDDDTVRQLRAAFDERGVLVFRGIDIDEDTQRRTVFTVIDDPFEVAERSPMLVSNKVKGGAAPYGRLLFHCDNMWARTPQPAISLYGVEVEPPGAPTLFVSMKHVWEILPKRLRKRVEGLEARHGFDDRYPNRGGDADVIDSRMVEPRSMTRPVCFHHPRTGAPLLYVSQQATIEILGLPEAENEELLEELFSYLYRPDAILSHDWHEGDLVLWDNIATQHGRGSVALQGPVRTLRKVTGPMNIAPDEQIKPIYSKVLAQE